MVREAATLYEAGQDCGAEANMAKHLAAEASWAPPTCACKTHGGFGFAEGIRHRGENSARRGFTLLRRFQPIWSSLISPSMYSACRGRIEQRPPPSPASLSFRLSRRSPAPMCTCRLPDAGARVIKIERPEGDFARGYDDLVHGECSYFVWLNRGKESIVLDLTRTEDKNLLAAMLKRADVFVQNLKPGAAQSSDFPWRGCAVKTHVICCSISGFGGERSAGAAQSLRHADPGRVRARFDHRDQRSRRASASPWSDLRRECMRSRQSSKRCWRASAAAKAPKLSISMFDCDCRLDDGTAASRGKPLSRPSVSDLPIFRSRRTAPFAAATASTS